jgi:predicted metal-dependent enzyme (double-stranded beta helix superfamily)
MFELDQFVADCRTALQADMPQKAVQEVVRRGVSMPGEILRAIGEPQRAEMQTLYRSDDLTILNVIWAPWMNLLPHNHQMWAIIGLYTGREDNIFWRRVPGSNGLVEAAGARALREKDAEPLGRDIIHSVSNPIPKLTGALHVYGGDFFGVPRSEWDAETLLEQQCSGDKMARRFEEANALLEAGSAQDRLKRARTTKYIP